MRTTFRRALDLEDDDKVKTVVQVRAIVCFYSLLDLTRASIASNR